MNILMINPPVREMKNPDFPLGLAYIGRVLLDEGYNVNVLDINLNRLSQKGVEGAIQSSTPDVFCIGGLIPDYKFVKWLTSIIKRAHPKSKIIVGGNVASPIPRLLLGRTHADIAVIGEGEITIRELISALDNSVKLSTVDGIWFKGNDRINQSPPRSLIKNIDKIRFPAWDLFQLRKYLDIDNEVPIFSSRGCPYQCIWCSHNVFGYSYHFRTAGNIIEELKVLVAKYNTKRFRFVDDNFILNRKRVFEFCNELINQNLDIEWRCNARVNHVDEELLKKMKSAGCTWLGYGIESGSQRILDSMKKGITIEQSREAINLTRRVGLLFRAYMMVGMLGETRETILESIAFCKENDVNIDKFFFITPFPGTPLYEKIRKEGKVENEEEYIEQLGEFSEKMLINLTDLSDEELIQLKENAEKEIHQIYKQKHPTYGVIIDTYKKYGFTGLMERVIKRLGF